MANRTRTRTRGGTFAALGEAASNVILPGILYAAVRYQHGRMSKKHPKRGRKTIRRR